MDISQYHSVRKWFLEYVESFQISDTDCEYHFQLKRNHSLRVSALSGLIAKKMGLDVEDVILAKIIGLLHDVGRFDQFQRYYTFDDRSSFDHGEYGAAVLSHAPFFHALKPSIQQTIKCALRYHNKAIVPNRLAGAEQLHTRLIRDADKLDILHITVNQLDEKSPILNDRTKALHGEISENVMKTLLQQKTIPYETIETELDFHLMTIGWVYDLNYAPSIQILGKRKFIAALKSNLPATARINAFLKQIDSYVSANMTNTRPMVRSITSKNFRQ